MFAHVFSKDDMTEYMELFQIFGLSFNPDDMSDKNIKYNPLDEMGGRPMCPENRGKTHIHPKHMFEVAAASPDVLKICGINLAQSLPKELKINLPRTTGVYYENLMSSNDTEFSGEENQAKKLVWADFLGASVCKATDNESPVTLRHKGKTFTLLDIAETYLTAVYLTGRVENPEEKAKARIKEYQKAANHAYRFFNSMNAFVTKMIQSPEFKKSLSDCLRQPG